jgi:hypothetical protein
VAVRFPKVAWLTPDRRPRAPLRRGEHRGALRKSGSLDQTRRFFLRAANRGFLNIDDRGPCGSRRPPPNSKETQRASPRVFATFNRYENGTIGGCKRKEDLREVNLTGCEERIFLIY